LTRPSSSNTSAVSIGATDVRLLLPPQAERSARGRFDGAWWPRTNDLGDQAGGLAAAVGDAWHARVARINYNPTIWTATPRRIRREGTPLRMGWFPSPEPQELSLMLLDGRRVELLVVPHEASADEAEWSMSRAVETGSGLHASEVLRLARSIDDGQGRWDDEGGRREASAEPPKGPSAT
jgi:Family of unknown function (DUF5994)